MSDNYMRQVRQSVDFAILKRDLKIDRYLGDQGLQIRSGNRFNATWRNGDSFSCSFDLDQSVWIDHKTNEGGSVLDLAMKLQGFSTASQAAHELAKKYSLGIMSATKPKQSHKVKTVAEYSYCDESGQFIFAVVRSEPKSFKQYHRDANGEKVWKMDGVRRVPYHLDELVKAVAEGRDIFIAEGEKDVDNLRQLGLTATCNPGGAGKWRDEYSYFLKGATGKVTIIADRDTEEKDYPGQHHAFAVKASLDKSGVTAKVVLVPEGTGKDASDFIDKGATAADFAELADSDEIAPPPVKNDDANILTNYTERKVSCEKGERRAYYAWKISDIRAVLFKATDNWPRKVGSTVFVFQPEKTKPDQRYLALRKASALFAWIRERLTPRWKSCNGGAQDEIGVNFVTMEQLFENISANAIAYEGISRAPHWPLRPDQFYDYREPPPQAKTIKSSGT